MVRCFLQKALVDVLNPGGVMKQLWLAIVPFVLLACSSPNALHTSGTTDRLVTKEIASQAGESSFQESTGTLNLSFDAKGNWLKITTRSSADLSDESPAAKDSALMIATMRAKRTLAEFLNNDVKSAKTLNRLAKSYARSFSSAENQETQLGEDSEAAENEETADKQSVQSRKSQRFAESLSERIHDNSAAIIKGGYVNYRAFEDGRAIVELTVARESIGVARQLSRMMSGVAQ